MGQGLAFVNRWADETVILAPPQGGFQYGTAGLPGRTVRLLADSLPADGEDVYIYYGTIHTLDATTSTLPAHLEDLVATGAGAYAALEWSSFATNRINVGGEEVWRQYLIWGQDRLSAFMRHLAQVSRKNVVRVRSLYVPDRPRPSQTTDWGP